MNGTKLIQREFLSSFDFTDFLPFDNFDIYEDAENLVKKFGINFFITGGRLKGIAIRI